jgi:murein DD-endopeptidase MepM/ murein hydrolase activator NlpD
MLSRLDRPVSRLGQQLASYREKRPTPYTPLGFDFQRPQPDYSSFERDRQRQISLSQQGTRLTQIQAFNTMQQRQQAELERLQQLAQQQIDLSGITPRFTGNIQQFYVPAGQQASGNFLHPLSGSNFRISSGYGPRSGANVAAGRISGNHTGIDFAAPTGTPIYATHSGVIQHSGWRGNYGNTIIISGGNGLQTLYAHQSRLAVNAGQQVQRGQLIGYVGSTGRSTGPHLHYEVRIGGRHVNPRGYF